MRFFRFAIWTVAVAVASVGQLLGINPSAVFACLILIAVLLATTPAKAIRLPRFVSEILIVGVTVLLAIGRKIGHPILQLSLVVIGLVVLRFTRKSPWWAVLIGWFPGY